MKDNINANQMEAAQVMVFPTAAEVNQMAIPPHTGYFEVVCCLIYMDLE